MGWLGRLFDRAPQLGPVDAARLARWQALPEESPQVPLLGSRVVVVDVESTGLNTRTDRLIAIGAIALNHGKVDATDAFYTVLKQAIPSTRDNILIHGIGKGAQLAGTEPVQALLDFLDYIGKAPLAGFHSGFDEIMIDRAARHFLRTPWRRSWLDLAFLAPALHAGNEPDRTGLDDWLDLYGIGVFRRHEALADAVATAQLLQVLGHRARRQDLVSVKQIYDAAAHARWLRQAAR